MKFERLSRYFKTDMNYLVRGGFWLNLGTILNTLISLLLLVAFGNYVTPETYGEYRYFFSLYGILIVASLGGFNSVVVRAAALGKEGELIRCFKIQSLGSLLGTAISFIIALYYYLNDNSILSTGFIIMGLALPLMESLDLYAAFLDGKKLFRQTAIASVCSQLFTTTALLVAIYKHERVLTLLATYFLSWIIIKGFFFLRTKKLYQKNTLLGEDTLFTGLNFTAVNFLNQVAAQLDRIALFHFIGSRELALYSFAIAPTEQLKGLFKNANTLILPKFAGRTEAEIRSNLVHKMALIGGAAAVVAVAYALTAPFIIGWFLPQYIEVIGASQIFAFSLIGVMVIPLNVAMTTIPKMKALYITNIVAPIVNILLIVILIPLYGFWGAIAAKGISRILNTFIQYAIFVRY